MTKKSTRAVAALAAATALAGGLTFLAPTTQAAYAATPASHSALKSGMGIPTPGVGDVLTGAKALYDFYASCTDNQAHGLPCTQTQGQTINQIYTALNEFRKKYDEDQVRNKEAIDEVIRNQKEESVKRAFESVRGDFEAAHVSMNIYTSMVDCTNAMVDGKESCKKVDEFGNEDGTQKADMASIGAEQALLVKNDSSKGFTLGATDLAQRVGGTTSNAHKGDSLLNAILDREQASEAARQGKAPGSRLNYYGADYVNRVGEETTSILEREGTYFAMRATAARFKGENATADGLDRLATKGRADATSPVLSIAQQTSTFTFPGWAPDKKLAANQGYLVGKEFGAVLLTNDGNSESKPIAGTNLPTAEKLKLIARVLGPEYDTLGKLYGPALPAPVGDFEGNPTRGSDSGVAGKGNVLAGRWWTAPQESWNGKLAKYDYNERDRSHLMKPNEVGNMISKSEETPVTVLGSSALFYREKSSGLKIKKIYARASVNPAKIEQVAVPYGIFSASTNTLGDWGYDGNRGQTPLALKGSPVEQVMGALGQSEATMLREDTPADFSAPTWDAFTHWERHYDGGNGEWLSRLGKSFGPGVLVRTQGVSAANMSVQDVPATGALQGM